MISSDFEMNSGENQLVNEYNILQQVNSNRRNDDKIFGGASDQRSQKNKLSAGTLKSAQFGASLGKTVPQNTFIP